MSVTYLPMRDDVVCELIVPKLTKAGLEVPASFGESYPRCRVLAVGPACSDLKLGDVVLADASRGYNVADKLALFPRDAVLVRVEGHSDDDVLEVEPSPLARPVQPTEKGAKIAMARRRH